jgi:uncharacterized membrane protein YdjX (TVP38/TMEM64 family)
LLGSVGAALFGFAIGRRGGKLLGRIVSPEERIRADLILARWGALAIAITRPIPLLAETVAIMAGASSSLGWGRMALAALVGSLPPALLYALTGAAAANFQSAALMFAVVLFVTGSFWLVGRFLEPYINSKKRRVKEQSDSNNEGKLRPYLSGDSVD